jgi:membrane-associated protease RseP (regulator of RpoE activity)
LAAAPASAVAEPSNDPRPTVQSQMVERFEWSTSKGRLGVMVMSLTPELRKHFGAPEDRGVIVAHVDPATPAAKAGIAVGDVIVEVRGRKIQTAPDVLSAVEDLGKGQQVKITVLRDGASRSLDATLTNDATANASFSRSLLRDFMKPFDVHHAFSTPFDEPAWFGDWLKPVVPKPDTDPAAGSSWLCRLRELVAPNSAAPACQRS